MWKDALIDFFFSIFKIYFDSLDLFEHSCDWVGVGSVWKFGRFRMQSVDDLEERAAEENLGWILWNFEGCVKNMGGNKLG